MPYNPMLLIQSVADENNPAIRISEFEANPLAALPPEHAWSDSLNPHAQTILTCANAVGVIRLKSTNAAGVSTWESLGTAFVIAPGVLMTNLHVLGHFGSLAAIDVNREAFVTFANNGDKTVQGHLILKAIAVGSQWSDLDGMNSDIAILTFDTTGLAANIKPLTFAQRKIATLTGPIVAIGYPAAFDSPTSWQARQEKVFGKPPIMAEKRLSPDVPSSIKIYKTGWAHKCSVLQGSSGSPLVDVATGHVMAVHYAGMLEHPTMPYNSAIPTAFFKRMLDSLITAGHPIQIAPPASPVTGPVTGHAGTNVNLAATPPTVLQSQSFGVLKDNDDFRDLPYRPTLAALAPAHFDAGRLPQRILNQGRHPSCTGHALVHLLACLDNNTPRNPMLSARMAYEMARLHDDLPGRNTPGSSLRGVIKGFFHNGLVPEPTRGRNEWDRPLWQLSIAASRKARSHALGAYYRLSPIVQDYHSAIDEVGCVLVSAKVHPGWIAPHNARGNIVYDQTSTALGHAFVLVGYDDAGFIVLNSAGPEWGKWKGHGGLAHWSYVDWADNLIDGWVLRSSVPAPSIFGKRVRSATTNDTELPLPRRSEVLGHLLLSEQGELADYGRAASNILNVRQTTRLFRKKAAQPIAKYQHLLLWAHGETTSEDDALRWIGATRNFFKSNAIYPVSLITAPYHAIAFRDLLASARGEAAKRLSPTAPGFEELLRQNLAKLGPKLWASYRDEQTRAAGRTSQFNAAVRLLVREAMKCDLKIHLVGHLGGIHLLSDLVASAKDNDDAPAISSLQSIASNMDWDEHHQFMRNLKSVCKSFSPAKHQQYCADERLQLHTALTTDWLSLLENAVRSLRQSDGHTTPRFLLGHYENALMQPAMQQGQLHRLDDIIPAFDGGTPLAMWHKNLLEQITTVILDRHPQFACEPLPVPKAFLAV